MIWLFLNLFLLGIKRGSGYRDMNGEGEEKRKLIVFFNKYFVYFIKINWIMYFVCC